LTVTLNDLLPDDVDLVETVCGDLGLAPFRPDLFADAAAIRLAAYDPDLAERLLDLPADDLAVLHTFLCDQQAGADALALSA
jgi:hypothetical protein